MNRNRKLIGFVMLAGAFLMAVLAALVYTEVLADVGAARDLLLLVLAAVAATDAAIGIVLVIRS